MGRVVDLSFPLDLHFRWKRGELVRTQTREEDVFLSSRVELSCHSHTHVDGESHYVEGGRSVDEMPLDGWIGEALVIDLTDVQEDQAISESQIEAEAGELANGDIALLRTDWSKRYDVNKEDYWCRAPFLRPEAAEWLYRRRPRMVGFDFPPDEPLRDPARGHIDPPREAHTVHWALLERGIPIVEYLTNLWSIEADRCLFAAAPLRLVGADASPVRAFAIVEEDT